MMQVRSFGVLQTSKLVAVLYLLIFAAIGIPVGVVTIAVSPTRWGALGLGVVILIPLLCSLVGFFFAAITCALYNVAAKWAGGIAIDIGPVAAEQPAPAAAPDPQLR